MDVGRGEDHDDLRWRLFERLQQGVEGLGGEHVDLVDDVDLELADGGTKEDAFSQVSDVANAAVGSGVDLDEVHVSTLVDGDCGSGVGQRVAVFVEFGVDSFG